MNKQDIGALVEALIRIKDNNDLDRSERDSISDACNLLYHHRDIIAEAEEQS